MRKINHFFFSREFRLKKESVCVSSSWKANPFFFLKGYTYKKFYLRWFVRCTTKSNPRPCTMNWISIPADEQSNFCVFPSSTQCRKNLLSLEKSFVKPIHRVIVPILYFELVVFTEFQLKYPMRYSDVIQLLWKKWFHEFLQKEICESKSILCPFCQKSWSPFLRNLKSLLSKSLFL